MTIDEAIKIKERNLHRGILSPTLEDKEADRLSLEALKQVKRQRQYSFRIFSDPLSGETEC